MCSKILVGLYGQRRRSSADELRLKASHLNKELWQWHRGLPKCLEWSGDRNTPAPPQVFILHMTFYFTLVLLHRPFLQFSQVSADLRNKSQSPLNSTTTCAIAAANITKLAINYKRCYNIRQVPTPVVHFMFIAGSIHLVNFRLIKMPNHNRLLRISMEALVEIGKSYPIAQKAAMVLQDLVGRWRPSHEADEPRAVQEADHSREDGRNRDSDFMAIEVPASKELDGFLEGRGSQEQAEDSSPSDLLSDIGLCEQLTEGQVGNNYTFLGSGTDWLSDRALFDPVDSNPCSLSYT